MKSTLPRVTAWSYSRLQDYRTCPQRFKFKHVDRMRDPPNAAMARGNDIHAILENYVAVPRTKQLPSDLQHMSGMLQNARKSRAQTELELAFTEDWHPTGWFEHDVWVRVKIDVTWQDGTERIVYDYKTGKAKPEMHREQLDLYALAAYLFDKAATTVRAGILYVDHPEEKPADALFTNRTRDVAKLKKYWETQVKKLFRDQHFEPTPSGWACNYCPFSKKKGGPCRAG